MADEFTKGPTHKLKEGISRYEIVYRVNDGDGWKVHRMFATKPDGSEKAIARETRARFMRHPQPFEIVTIRCLGNEIPIQTGQPVLVKTESELASQQNAMKGKFAEKEIEERAKESGLWFPGIGKLDA